MTRQQKITIIKIMNSLYYLVRILCLLICSELPDQYSPRYVKNCHSCMTTLDFQCVEEYKANVDVVKPCIFL